MRGFGSVAAGVVAVLALLVALPAGWVATHVTSEKGFVSLVGPLATDARVIDVVTDEITANLTGSRAVPIEVPESVYRVAREAVQKSAERVAGDPGWRKAWDQSIASSHQSLFGSRAGARYFSIDVAPVAAYVINEVSGPLPITLAAPESVPILLETSPDQRGIDAVKAAPGVAIGAGVVGLLAAAISIALARRRPLAVIGLGMGAIIGAALEWPVVGAASSAVTDHLDTNVAIARAVAERLADRAQDSAESWLSTTMLAGVAAVVLGVLLSLAARTRRGPQPD